MSARNPMVKCHAKNRAGGTCGHWAMHGQSVCYLHGGHSPQALKKAEARFRDLVHPAIGALERLIDKDEFQAVRYVLDYAGFRAVEQSATSSESDIRVTVHFDHADQTLSLADGS